MYRTGHAYHPAHPFFMWYWGEAGRQWLGKVIVVGADNAYVPKVLGWETASSMNEALEMAKGAAPHASPEITLLHMPPILMADVSIPGAPSPPPLPPGGNGNGKHANGNGANGHLTSHEAHEPGEA
jgi:hypothetical protein